MEFPSSVTAIINSAAAKYPSDINRAVTIAERLIRRLPEFDELVSMLVRDSILGKIHDARHCANIRMKRDAGAYGGPAKVVSGLSDAVNRVAESVYYNFAIDGKALGNIMGDELKRIAGDERAKSDGHMFNYRLCQRLAAMVPEGKRVRDAVTEKKLKSIFRDLERGDDGPKRNGLDIRPQPAA